MFEVNPESGLNLIEIGDGTSIEELITSTGCDFTVSPDLKPMQQIALPTCKFV